MQSVTQFFSQIASLPWLDWVLWTVAALCFLVGIVGTLVPAVPGVTLVFAGALIVAWIGHFEAMGWGVMTLLALLTVLGVSVDWIAQAMGAKKAGATRYGMAGALVGTVVGLFFGLIGILFFPLLGAFIGEVIGRQTLTNASKIGIATWVGMLVGSALKLLIACAMLAVVFAAQLAA